MAYGKIQVDEIENSNGDTFDLSHSSLTGTSDAGSHPASAISTDFGPALDGVIESLSLSFSTTENLALGVSVSGDTVSFTEGQHLQVLSISGYDNVGSYDYVVGSSSTSDFDIELPNGLFANRVFDWVYPTIKLADYLAKYPTDPAQAIKDAFTELFDNETFTTVLDCGGIPIELDETIVIDSSVITTGAGYRRMQKRVKDLNIRASTDISYTSGDALLYIGVEYGESKVRHLYLENLTIDVRKRSGLNGLQLQNYYNVFVTQPNIRGLYDSYGLYVTRATDSGTGDVAAGHGLVVTNAMIHSEFSDWGNGQVAVYLEDGDVILQGGILEWVDTGVYSTNGNFKCHDIHFSYVTRIIYCNDPQIICVKNCDVDNSGYIEIEDEGETVTWRGIQITGNEFTLTADDDELPTDYGLITMTTGQTDAVIEGLVIDDNTVVNNGPGGSVYGAAMIGDWADFYGVFRWPQTSSNVTAQNISKVANLLGGSALTGYKTFVDKRGKLAFEDENTTTQPQIYAATNTLVLGTNGTDKLYLDSGGNLAPATDNVRNLGSASGRFGEIYCGNATINTSDEDEKTFYEISDAEKSTALAIKSSIKKFKWNDSISEKGEDGARIHVGVGAQTVKSIFEDNGLDPDEYSLFCYDEWYEDENGNVADVDDDTETSALTLKSRYGIRYTELIMFILSSV